MSGRSTPSLSNSHRHSQRSSRTLEPLKKVQINGSGVKSSDNVFASLRATQLVASKPVLPAELIATIVDFLPVPDLIRCASVSRRLQEMVYDDSRWIQKLRSMHAWNETEARQRFEEAMKRKADSQKSKQGSEGQRTGLGLPSSVNGIAGTTSPRAGSVTLFDAGVEEDRPKRSIVNPQSPSQHRRRVTLTDGFDELTVAPSSPAKGSETSKQANPALDVFNRVRSIRGHAKQEFGKIYAALNPIYLDLSSTNGHSDALVFRTFRDPEQQAQVLANVKRFAPSDNSIEWRKREEKLEYMIGVFENAVLREFQQGHAAGDIDGRMRRYAHVLVTLNGGSAGIDAFISSGPVMARTSHLGNPLDCLEGVAYGHVDLNPSQQFFEKLAAMMIEQSKIIDRVFPASVDVLTPYLSRLCDEIVSDYITSLLDEAHSRNNESFVKAVAGTFSQGLRFVASLRPTKASPANFLERGKQMVVECFHNYVNLYLTEELEVFKSKSEAEVSQWDRELSEQEASTESFFMSNVSRQAAKRDFLSSFKKVVMMPVNALPSFPMSSPFSSTKPTNAVTESNSNLDTMETSYTGGKSRAAELAATSTPPLRSSTPQPEAPTTELAAKAAIMNSRLEGIRSLFSLEVALNLTHLAKASIERAALMAQTGGKHGADAKEQCGTIFVTLIDILGNRHIRNGFDKAVNHLTGYNPRDVRTFREQVRGDGSTTEGSTTISVEPLVTFLELVNVGDLIQQMVDVFYAQELVTPKLIDRDDFLDQSVKEKKKFEQMLDERVAAGLNKGIDVLMEEVEFICATTQTASDFNPGAANEGAKSGSAMPGIMDIGPSITAQQVVDMVSSHTGMLIGSTDKNMLDVFMQEVGLRLFGVLCKHFKRQRISVDGSIKLISDINHYSAFVATLRQKPLQPYFQALREMSQIYLVHIDPPAAYFSANAKGSRTSFLSSKSSTTALQSKELATIIADTQRYHGIFPVEEVYEFAERRADWYLVKGDVERAMYGVGCILM